MGVKATRYFCVCFRLGEIHERREILIYYYSQSFDFTELHHHANQVGAASRTSESARDATPTTDELTGGASAARAEARMAAITLMLSFEVKQLELVEQLEHRPLHLAVAGDLRVEALRADSVDLVDE